MKGSVKDPSMRDAYLKARSDEDFLREVRRNEKRNSIGMIKPSMVIGVEQVYGGPKLGTITHKKRPSEKPGLVDVEWFENGRSALLAKDIDPNVVTKIRACPREDIVDGVAVLQWFYRTETINVCGPGQIPIAARPENLNPITKRRVDDPKAKPIDVECVAVKKKRKRKQLTP